MNKIIKLNIILNAYNIIQILNCFASEITNLFFGGFSM
jgi:hypothetical protein